MRGHAPILPTGDKLLPMIKTRKLDDIGAQYLVSRQAVWERIDTYCRKTFGMGLKEYRETDGAGYSATAS